MYMGYEDEDWDEDEDDEEEGLQSDQTDDYNQESKYERVQRKAQQQSQSSSSTSGGRSVGQSPSTGSQSSSGSSAAGGPNIKADFSNIGKGMANGAKNTGKAAGKGLKAAGKGISSAIKGMAAAVKSLAAAIKAIAAALAAAAPVVMVVIIVIAVIAFLVILFAGMDDQLTEERGTTQEYSMEEIESNVTGVDLETGVRYVIALTEPQALKTAYYRLMSCASYTKLVDGELIYFYNPEETDPTKADEMREDFATLQDYFGNERYYLLSSDFIMMADEIFHQYELYYPEQLIKPVVYKEDDEGDLKLQDIMPDDQYGLNSEIKSTAYKLNDEGIYEKDSDAEKVNGIWDYGLGSVLKYEPWEKNIWMQGTILNRDVVMFEVSEDGKVTYWIENVPVNQEFLYGNEPGYGVPIDGIKEDMPIESAEDKKIGGRTFHDATLQNLYGNNTTIYPIKIPLISSVVTFSGDVSYEYEYEVTETPFSSGITSSKYQGYETYQYSVWTDPNTGETTPLYENRTGSTFIKVPKKTEENKEGIGMDYLIEYNKQYNVFAPYGLTNDLEFLERTEDTYDILVTLGLLKPYSGEIGNVMLGPGASLSGDDATYGGAPGQWDSWNELTQVAHLIAAEAANDKLDKLMVGAVLMNLVHSDSMPDTVMEVIKYKNPGPGGAPVYACFWTDPTPGSGGFDDWIPDGGTFATKEPTEMDIESAKQVLTGEFALPENVIFQSQQQLGSLFMKVGVHYYCTPGGESPAVKDRFDRTALTADQLKTLASQLDGAGSSIDSGSNEGIINSGGIGGEKKVTITYYCAACNDPRGSDAIAWSGGLTNGHATANVTCAMSEGSRKALGVEYGDYIFISGIGERRVEDLCGAGLGTNIKSDQIVIDLYVETSDGTLNGECNCNQQGINSATAYKTIPGSNGEEIGFQSSDGLYYVDMDNPFGFDLYDAAAFDTYSATKAYEQFADPNMSWFERLKNSVSDATSNLFEKLEEWFSSLGVMKSLNAMFSEEAMFSQGRYYMSPESHIEMVQDIVLVSMAMTQNKLYDEVVAEFDEENMDILFVGNIIANGNGMFQQGMIILNGVGTTVEGFISPTDIYYQPIGSFSDSTPAVEIATPSNISVYASYNGVVEEVDSNNNKIVITYTHGTDIYKIIYMNVVPSVLPGDTVNTNTVIGKTSGNLSLTVYKNGAYVDPMKIFYQPEFGEGLGAAVSIAVQEWNNYDGVTTGGYKYCDDMGLGRGNPWCACFVSYCYDHAGLMDAGMWDPDNIFYCPSIRTWLMDVGWWREGRSGYVPKPGDCVLFDYGQDGVSDHIGLVVDVVANGSSYTITTIEGNTNNDKLGSHTYDINKSSIMGFGSIGGT